jgi:hypothetical protein
MKYLITFILAVLVTVGLMQIKPQDNNVIVIEEGWDEERPVFTVRLSDGTKHEYMYAEEIAQGLLSGSWTNDETLRLTQDSEYQLFLEPDSLMIYSFGRKVAAVPYNQTGALDSIFMKDNE